MSIASGTGLISGINYNDIITKMIQADAAPITQLQRQEATITSQKTTLATINKALLDFQTKAQNLSSSSSFVSMSASVSDYSVMSAATTGSSTTEGSYSYTVNQLAQADRRASQGVATLDSTPIASADGTFKFKVGSGAEQSIDVTAGMNLQQLRDKINALSSSGVHASIVNDGTATKPYRLVLTGSDTGQDNTINITHNDTTLNLSTNSIEDAVAASGNSFNGTVSASGNYTGKTGSNIIAQITSGGGIGQAKFKVSLDGGLTWSADDAFTTSTQDQDITGAAAQGVNLHFTDAGSPKGFAAGDRFTIDTFVPQLQKAQNALITVDGIQVSRPTNTFSDVIDGVTLTAKKVSSDTQTLTVQNNSSGVTSQVKDFVTAFNTLVDTINKSTAYDATNKSAAALFGDSGVRGILTTLHGVLNNTVPGSSTYNTLSSVGVTLDDKGHLNVDTTKLNNALDADPNAVKSLFTESGKSNNTAIKLSSSSEKTKVGSYTVNVTTAATQATLESAQALDSGGLAADESLNIVFNQAALTVNLAAGMKIDQVIDTLNAQFRDKGMSVQASNDGGKLKINSTAYGSANTLTVSSNRAASDTGQLGLGTTVQSNTGIDVVGTINGGLATGVGQTLKGALGSDAEGLALTITSTAPTSGTINLNHGAGLATVQAVNSITDSKNGLFATRNAGYDTRMKDYDDQISSLQTRLSNEQTRMTKQFNDLETKLATLQSQGNSLLSQLASLTSSSA